MPALSMCHFLSIPLCHSVSQSYRAKSHSGNGLNSRVLLEGKNETCNSGKPEPDVNVLCMAVKRELSSADTYT